MNGNTDVKFKGIANLFDKTELRSFIINYLIILLVVEGLIFFVSFVIHLSSADAGFPWRPFIFASFIAPVAITFMFGVVILFFNKYLYDSTDDKAGSEMAQAVGDLNGSSKITSTLYVIRQVPFLLGLLLFVLAAGVIYKIDDILLFIGHAGERAAFFLVVSLAVILGVAALFGLIWMYLSYKLRREKMNYQYQYRKDVAERLGLVILEDNTVFDGEGKMISYDKSAKALPASSAQENNQEEAITLIPDLADEDEEKA